MGFFTVHTCKSETISFLDISSLVILNCTFKDNHGSGVSLSHFIGNMEISATTVVQNTGNGMAFERFYGTVTATNAQFTNNSADGLKVLESSFLSFNIQNLSSKGNDRNGLYLQRVALTSNVFNSSFDKNTLNGFSIANGAGEIKFQRTSTVLNTHNGISIDNGNVSSSFNFCNFSSNREDGCSITNQGGAYQFSNCTANSNSRHGVSLADYPGYLQPFKRFFKQFTLTDSTFDSNTQYGVKLALQGRHSDLTFNVTIAINRNSFARNSRGGVCMSPDYDRSWYGLRKVEAVVTNNHFEQNEGNALYMNNNVFSGFEAIVKSNIFIKNTDKVMTLVVNGNCGASCQNVPVNVIIRRNSFKENIVENVLFIDYRSFHDTRFAVVRNNTFENNKPSTGLNPNFFQRETTRAVIVLKEGSFTMRENILENPSFTYQLSTLRRDHHRVIDAKFNWWGTTDECKIVDRIFDFQHRVHLSPVEFFPYHFSLNKTSFVHSSAPRPFCFLRGSSIGGIVDRPLALSTADSPYEVRDDIIVLTNGTLTIPGNVTLMFPSKSVMVIQGKLLVNGTANKKVRFAKKQHQGAFRLGGGAGPWEGRVEFLINETWWPICLPYYRSFSAESKIICQQLDAYYHYYYRRSSVGNEPGFVHNVVCDEKVDNDILNCSANKWSYGPTCRGYTVRVTCQQHNWVGLHLAMTNHRSLLRHLVISDAGFPYRSDIRIPGAALKVDLSHHYITNVVISNSVGFGVQVVYQSLIHNRSLMPHSTIVNTRSHGIFSLSPSLVLTDVNITRNDGSGFVHSSTWDGRDSFTAYMASPDVYKTFHVCSENKTFLLASGTYLFSLETLERNAQLRCQHVMETEPGYKLVVQVIYHSAHYYYYWRYYRYFLHVFDGVNTSVGSSWKVESLEWRKRPVFNSTSSSIVFDLYKRANLAYYDVKFFVFTVKG